MPAMGILFVALADAFEIWTDDAPAGNAAHVIVGLLLVSQGIWIWIRVRPGPLASAGILSAERCAPLPLVMFVLAMIVVTAAQARIAQNHGGSS